MRTLYSKLKFIPTVTTFSDLEDEDGEIPFDPMDQVDIVRKESQDTLDMEILVMQVMNNLNDKEKVVFLFQLMRADGYRIDHESCSKVIHVTLRTYMNILKRVRGKAKVMFRQL